MSYLNFLDMIDGGGAGRSGDTFKGGLFSALLNNMGIKPRGFKDREEPGAPLTAMRPMPAPRPMPRPAPNMTTGTPMTEPVMPPYGVGSGPRTAYAPSYASTPAMPSMPMTRPSGMASTPDFVFGPNQSAPMAAPMPQEVRTPSPFPPITFEQFVENLGPAAYGIDEEILRRAYELRMVGR